MVTTILSHLNPAHCQNFYYTLYGGQLCDRISYKWWWVLDQWPCLQIWATDMFLVPSSYQAADALCVLCCLNIVVSIPAAAIILVIHWARVCEVTDLCGLRCEMNILKASAWRIWAVLSKYAFKDRTRQIEGDSGNAKTVTQPLIVFSLECWKHKDQSITQILILH